MSADTRLRYACDTRVAGPQGLAEALALLADAGLHGAVLAADGPHLQEALDRPGDVRDRLDALCLEVVLDAGAVPADGRLERVRGVCDLADALRAEAVLLRAPTGGEAAQLADGLAALVASHGHAPYALALRPAPGTLVEDADAWARLHAEVPGLSLALATGHGPAAVHAGAAHLRAAVLDDPADPGLPAALQALVDVTYDGLVAVAPRGEPPAAVVRALLAVDGGAAPHG